MKEIKIRTNERGFVLEINGTSKFNGEHSYSPLEDYEMLERVCEVLLNKKVKIIDK